MSLVKEYCQLLNISENATATIIKKAYYKKAKRYYPNKGVSIEQENLYKEYDKAYDYLYDNLIKN